MIKGQLTEHEDRALNGFARYLWEHTIRPNLIRRPSSLRRLLLSPLPVHVVAVPPDADLPRSEMISPFGCPLHRFKMDGGDRWYYYGPEPFPKV